ncbi:MAG TPA: hypothetical protein VMB79_00710 [Jatrophihabitans sp.]|nr:hypothetical protein [Jatrophihabitans sp.]
MRLAILGGGGFRVPLVYRALLRRPELGVTELVLADADPARLAVIARIVRPAGHLAVRLAGSPDEAVTGADFVFSAIRAGGVDGRAADERRAVRAGVLGQETVGAAGLAYALRTLPAALRIARAVADRAPSAWLINFTNPAGLVTEASRATLGDRVIGICDSPAALVGRACRALGVPPSAVRPDYLGINHLGWLRGLSAAGGAELLPALLADDDRLLSFEEGRLFGSRLLRRLGTIPNEYLYFYYHSRELLAAQRDAPTRGEVVAGEQRAFYAAAAAEPGRTAELWEQARRRREETYLAEARSTERDAADLVGGGYEGIALRLMAALAGGPPDELVLNVANRDTVPQLPADLVLETGCGVDAAGARPLPAGPLGLAELGLIASVRAAERAALHASATGSREAAVHAFASHPLIASERIALRLLDDLLRDEPGLLGTG